MSRGKAPRPTDAELGILRVLWRRGPCTVRQIQRALTGSGAVSGASVLKLLHIMVGKGLVDRDASRRAHVFAPRFGEQEVQQQLMDHLVDGAFEGSAARLALRALASRPSTPQELAEIEELIERFKDRKGGDG